MKNELKPLVKEARYPSTLDHANSLLNALIINTTSGQHDCD